eukprot:GCRY01000472.1.p1 GENE.GCRY01000472.1~~GCRY01000472.1.p1  ORF type:complete len:220 (+),score=27.81 GCRY01000472.1:67-660(+)
MLKFLVVLFALIGCSLALTFTVDPHKEECFYEDAKEGTKLGLSFQVTSGGFLDIDVTVTDPTNQVVYKGERETEGKYTFITGSSGVFKFCFSNRMSTYTHKSVSFGITKGEATASNFAKAEDLDPIEQSIIQLSNGLSAIQSEQKHQRIRERVHRNTAESTNSRVLWWSIFEAIILLGMSVWQIVTLRKFFSSKTTV